MNWKFALLVLTLIGFSCDIINPDEEVPAYIHINEFSLTTNETTEGSNSAKITEAWVFVDGAFLGVYDLPAQLPILQTGEVELKIEAGIKENGRSLTPDIYPFYAPYELTVNLVPNETIEINPTTTYADNAEIVFIEDFEDTRPRVFTESITGNQEIIRTEEHAFEGQYSGQFYVSNNNAIVEFSTPVTYNDLMENGVYVYLEVNYRSDAPVSWGIVGEQDAITGLERFWEAGFLPKPEWNKIYFNISPSIVESQLDDYKIALRGDWRSQDPDSSLVHIDNIKLVRFK